jgi:hypothetical protein
MSVPFIYTDGVLTLVLGNKTFTVLQDHPNRKMILENLPTATVEQLLEIVDVKKALPAVSGGRVEVKDGQVYFDGEVVHSSIAKRIIKFMEESIPFDGLVKFLENLMQNPSMTSQKELYDFLDHEHLPITEDGCFLAYKCVRPDYTDKHTGKTRNMVGDKPEMPRAKVDDDRSRGCSNGYHVGALNYAAGFGSVDHGDHLMICKVNPADVVSVPTDCNCEKLRTCKYEVVGEYEGELKKPLYASDYSYDDVDEEEYDEEDYDWSQYDEEEYADDEDYEDEDDGMCGPNGCSWCR